MLSLLNILLTIHLTTSIEDVEKFPPPSSDAQYVYLVRHGESLFNVIKYTQGSLEWIPLTEKGKNQAINLGKQLAQKIHQDAEIVICSSTAKRARDTAQHLLEELGQKFEARFGGDYRDLVEIDSGIWQGMPKDERYQEELRKWHALSAHDKFLNPKVATGENYHDALKRALPALQEIVEQHPGKMIFVVVHGDLMNALKMHFADDISHLSTEPGTKLPLLSIGNCDLFLIEVPKGKEIKDSLLKERIIAAPLSD